MSIQVNHIHEVHLDVPYVTEQERLDMRIKADKKGLFDEKHPMISFCPERGTLTIGRDVIRVLNYPYCIDLLQDDAACQVAIAVGDPEDPQTFQVPKGFPEDTKKSFRINSKAYVEEMMEMHQRSRFYETTGEIAGAKEKSFQFMGVYNAKHQAVIFQL